ncbi:MAG: HAMP domain-containing histidine kinase [Epsilonproteobacteria bacterium]|nr:HAMP domain-containing histidine kinase [Campylobacterota bacterium]
MKKSSIFSSITFIFIMATIGVIFTFILFYQYEREQDTKNFLNRYALLSKSIQYQLVFSPTLKDFFKLLEEYHMKPIKDVKKALYILNHTPIVFQHTSSIGTALILKDNDNAYLYVSTKHYSLLLKDMAYNTKKDLIYISIFVSILILIIMAYIWTIKKLLPLKKLKVEIDKFAKGNLDVKVCQLDNDDEIADVANAFNNAVKQIKRLNSSRILFLRNIMHELKTPITKGRITAEMLPEGKNKERLISVFEKLQNLLDEFITIEKISSGFINLERKSFRLIDIIDEAIDLAMIDRSQVELIKTKELNLKVDFKLFSVAIKNMIDNAIKYSPDKKVQIIVNDKAIIFKNRGEKLQKDLKEYMEPFTSEGNQKDSFGLGLYLVDNILRAHKLQLLYSYKDGWNTFVFKGIKNIISDNQTDKELT